MPRAMPPMMTAVSTGLRRRLLRAMRTLYRSIVASLRRLQRAAEKRRRAVDVDHPSVEEVDLARCPRRAFRAVRDHDDGRAALVDLIEQIHDLARHERVEVSGRLVGQDQLRVRRQNAGDGYPLLLTARHLRRQMMQPRGEADHLRRLLDTRFPLP